MRKQCNKTINYFTRREFISSCTMCLAYASAVALFGKNNFTFAQNSAPTEKVRVKLIYSHLPPEEPGWPYKGYNYESRKKEIFLQLQKNCPNIEFLPVTVSDPQYAKEILMTDTNIDGYLVYCLGIFTGVPEAVVTYGKPTILVDDLYGGSGEFLKVNAIAKRQGLKAAGVTSSRFEDVVEALKCLEVIKKLKSAKMLVVVEENAYCGNPDLIREIFGTETIRIHLNELAQSYNSVEPKMAVEWAKRWIQNAEKVVEPDKDEITRSGAMYLAMKALLDKYNAPAFSIDCLHYYYDNKIPAYPCLGFFQLNNDGFVGACEGDLKCAVLMLMFKYLAGRPGYISDPVIDTAKNQIIYAHCVGSNKVFGPNGPSNPYHIRSHSEDRRGAAVRSLMPLGEITTSVALCLETKEIVMHQSKTIANIDEDKGCRTKLAAEITGNINQLLSWWDRFGWHRVTAYGNYKNAISILSSLLSLKLIEES